MHSLPGLLDLCGSRSLELFPLVVDVPGVTGLDEVLIEDLVHLLLVPSNLLGAQLVKVKVIVVNI